MNRHKLLVPVAVAALFLWAAIGVLWAVVGGGWPIETYVPVAIAAAYAIGWLHGEDYAWQHQLRIRERDARRTLAIAHILRDPDLEQVTTPAAERQRDQAMWN